MHPTYPDSWTVIIIHVVASDSDLFNFKSLPPPELYIIKLHGKGELLSAYVAHCGICPLLLFKII